MSCAAATVAAAARLAAAGCEVSDVELPSAEQAVAAYYLIASAEASANLARFDGVRYGMRRGGAGGIDDLWESTRGAGFGPEVKRRIMLGTFVLSAGYYDAYYDKAQRVRTVCRRQVDALFGHVDALLLPTSPTTAFALGERLDRPLEMYRVDLYTVLANLTGGPALSFPRRARGLHRLNSFADEARPCCCGPPAPRPRRRRRRPSPAWARRHDRTGGGARERLRVLRRAARWPFRAATANRSRRWPRPCWTRCKTTASR